MSDSINEMDLLYCQMIHCRYGATNAAKFVQHMRIIHGVTIDESDIGSQDNCAECGDERWLHKRRGAHSFVELAGAAQPAKGERGKDV